MEEQLAEGLGFGVWLGRICWVCRVECWFVLKDYSEPFEAVYIFLFLDKDNNPYPIFLSLAISLQS